MKNIYKALAEFQQEIPAIFKEDTGYGYNYAGLPVVLEAINPLMKKYGMGFYQAVNGTNLKTVIFHVESGESIESDTAIPQGVQLSKMNDFQVLGSGITYLRRYALSSLLGIVTDKDEDMAGKQKKTESIDVAPKLSPDEANTKALQALEDAETLEDLNVVRTQVSKSKILTAGHKKILEELYQKKVLTFDPTA